ncbi:serine hydrolase domain-containing protein [Marivivens marinus]|uniref:serine hydrolase domain-containing protein n=1 Tax=Marivivens marinus TaxID=3110173 RepID=UPI003B8463CE
MKRAIRWIGRILLALVLAAAVFGLWKREEITRLLAVNSLFSEDKIVGNFSGMDGLFHTVPVPRGGGPVSPLPAGPTYDLPADVDRWIVDRNVTGLVVLHDGQMVHESYYLGTDADDLRISWSVAKSFLSALVGVLVEEGAIGSLDDQVTDYAPSLAGSAYDGTTLRDVLQMSSGVMFDEDYLDFNSDINKMGRVLALGGSMDAFAAGQDESFAAPGTVWQYVSIDTHVIGMVVRGATGRDIPSLLSEKIIAPLGLEADPLYLTDGYGVAFVLGGLNLRTRDYARFGQMIAQGGNWQGRQIVPADWIDASTRPSANTAEGATGYGYQWWVPVGATPGEEFFARGIYGQYIYIDRARNVVIAVNSADRLFREPGVHEKNIQILRTIARDL